MSGRETHQAGTAAAGQPDLFGEGGLVEADRGPAQAPPQVGVQPTDLTDDELIALLPEATLSEAEHLCAAAVSRSLEASVPSLVRLWRRFAGFGIDVPLVEQRAVLGALAALACGPARSALKRIVLSEGLPAAQLPLALRAAADAGLVLPAAFVGPLLEHRNPAVRELAFALALKAGVPDLLLRGGLDDPCVPVRRAAVIALGRRGDAGAREALIAELAADPSRAVIEALAAIGDDGAIVHLGRCAERHPALAGTVVDVLRDMESARAERLAGRLEAAGPNTGRGGG